MHIFLDCVDRGLSCLFGGRDSVQHTGCPETTVLIDRASNEKSLLYGSNDAFNPFRIFSDADSLSSRQGKDFVRRWIGDTLGGLQRDERADVVVAKRRIGVEYR